MTKKKIFLIGAGQIGSRHLQALARVKIPLEITVIEPLKEAMAMAKKRLTEVKINKQHSIVYLPNIPQKTGMVDLVIVATTSRDRRKIIEEILKQATVRYFILEKLLFQKKKDFADVEKLLKRAGAKTFVNCMMRTIPFFYNLKNRIEDPKLTYIINSTDAGLATCTIHYLDHIAFLTGCFDFNVDTAFLDPVLKKSKRKGFLEVTGSLRVTFANGSLCIFNHYAKLKYPTEIIIYNSDIHLIARELDGKAFVSARKNAWVWKEELAKVPYQSTMTTGVVEKILTRGSCPLVEFSDAIKLHLPFLEALLKFVNAHSKKKYNYYPFT